MTQPINKFWIVTKATRWSTLGDICFMTDARGLLLQGKGGLEPDDIVLTTLDVNHAEECARQLIEAAQGKAL